MMAILEMPLQTEADEAQAYASLGYNNFFRHYEIKPVPGIAYNPTGQTIVEKSNGTDEAYIKY